MLDLTRTVRFCLTPDPADDDTPRSNTYSAWPAPRGLPRYYELHVTCRGEADPRTGYFINIKHIDTAVRDHALPLLRDAVADEAAAAATPMGTLMRRLFAALNPALDRTVIRLGLQLTPRIEIAVTPAPAPAPGRDQPMDRVQLSQEYEFSAAHRLHVPEYSDEQNRQTFGKCNNPAGHGHNYRVRVVVDAPIDPAGHTLAVADLDAAVDRHVIEHLDHKHLNRDVPAFADRNPSVEHIAQVVWGMLVDALPREFPGAGVTLAEVSVWETGKTVCTYRGPVPVAVQ